MNTHSCLSIAVMLAIQTIAVYDAHAQVMCPDGQRSYFDICLSSTDAHSTILPSIERRPTAGPQSAHQKPSPNAASQIEPPRRDESALLKEIEDIESRVRPINNLAIEAFNKASEAAQLVQNKSSSDIPSGYGELALSKARNENDRWYMGQIRNGKMNGLGILGISYSDGMSAYNGEFVDNKEAGYGVLRTTRNSKEDAKQGQFRNGKLTGLGHIYTKVAGKEIQYYGDCANNLPNGIGVEIVDKKVLSYGLWRDGKLITTYLAF